MKMTSAQAAKLLRQLKDELATLNTREYTCKTFVAAQGEDLEMIRPKYDYTETKTQMAEIEGKIRKLKHILNVFNCTTVIPEFNITIDEMLVFIPQLTKRCSTLSGMKNALPIQRERSVGLKGIIEYTYANYDIELAQNDYDALSETLANAQTALDYVNNTVEMEVDI
jgi:hypothetical protein